MGIILAEHQSCTILLSESEHACLGKFDKQSFSLSLDKAEYDSIIQIVPRTFKISRGKTSSCFNISNRENDLLIQAGYYIGVDWLIPNIRYIHVEPKLNTSSAKVFSAILEVENPEGELLYQEKDRYLQKVLSESVNEKDNYREINYLSMLLDAMTSPNIANETDDLIWIDWEAPEIFLEQVEDRLTPFLIVQFINLLSKIVRKGLKKSYYTVKEHINNRIKGKILISQQIKQNVMKNRVTKTYCEYQVFDIDHNENQFLKNVLRFASKYVDDNEVLFGNNIGRVKALITFILPALEHVSFIQNEELLRNFKFNPFFKEYKDAVKIGHYILKRFSYNISKASNELTKTPPFWIDMPRLFELYVYQKLLLHNPLEQHYIKYQFRTYGNELDYLVSKPGFEMIIDAKYKMKYSSSLIHQDIRQVAGYARLKKVLKQVQVLNEEGELLKNGSKSNDAMIDCMIIYPDLDGDADFDFNLEFLRENRCELNAYHRVFKIGVPLPLIN